MADTKDTETKFPRYLPIHDNVYSVYGYITEDPELIKNGYYVHGKGYVEEKTGYIFIFTSTGEPKYRGIPYLTLEDGKIVKHPSMKEDDENPFHLSNSMYMEPIQIASDTADDEVLYSEKDLYAMNSAVSTFSPIINDTDDGLKKVVKKMIATKGRNINTLKNMTTEKYTLPNIKAALMNDTKMSIKNFITWCELLGADFEIRVTDRGTDKQYPLKHDIVYSSLTDRVYVEDVEDPNTGEPLEK